MARKSVAAARLRLARAKVRKKRSRAISPEAQERLQKSEKRIAAFRRAYARVGIQLDDATLAAMAAQEPIDIRCRLEVDPEEEGIP